MPAANDSPGAPVARPARVTRWRHGLAVVLLATTLPALAASAPARAEPKPPSPAELDARRDDLSALRARIKAVQREIAEAESSRREAADELRQSERAISDLRRETRRLASEQRAVEARLARLGAEQKHAESALAGQQAQIAALLRRQLRYGDVDPLRLALSGRPPAEIARDRLLLARIARERTAIAEDTRESLARTRELAAETQREQRQLASLAETLRERHAELSRQQRERQRVVSRISAQLAQQRNAVARLREDEQRLSRLIRKLAKLVESRSKPPTAAASVSRPAGGYAGFDRNSDFARQLGALPRPVRARADRRERELKGIFFAAATGSEVQAVAAGQVVFADWLRGFGNLLVIDHGENFMSIYGNNEALLAEVGDRVGSGETIATAGSSGGQSESGLYFEMRFRGDAIDPLPWLRAP
jgi:septal ring factor EnvC (AmiA/AmiB activator)